MSIPQKDCNGWALTLVCLTLAVTATGCTTPVILQQRVVEAEKIVLKDATGKVRLQIAIDEGGGIVQTFLDAKGTERLKLMVDAENVVRQRFFDEKGTIRMGSYVYPADHPRSARWVGTDILNKEGKVAIRSAIDTQRIARHQLFNEKGAVRIGSYVNPTDYPKMAESAGTEWINDSGAWIRIRTLKGGRPIMSLWTKTIQSASR